MVARGDVWWYEPPDHGRRPFLVLTRTEVAPLLNQVLAVPATRTVRGLPTEVALDRSDGMPVECVLNLDSTTGIAPAFCTSRITTLGPKQMEAVCRALLVAAQC